MRKLRQPVDASLSAVTHNIDEIKRTFNKYKGEALVKALKKNFFEAYYVESKEEAAARSRIANVAAPMNKIKYGEVCASVLSGKCARCKSEQRFCNITTILHQRPIESDYHIIIVGEELGF